MAFDDFDRLRRSVVKLASPVTEPDTGQHRTRELLATVESFNRSKREMLRERLENMDPYAFEQLICDLLTEMGYEEDRGLL
jgi:hypothetical protein